MSGLTMPKTEIQNLILGTVLVVVGGIGGPWLAVLGLFGLAAVALGIGIMGIVQLILTFREYQWEDLKLYVKTAVEVARGSERNSK